MFVKFFSCLLFFFASFSITDTQAASDINNLLSTAQNSPIFKYGNLEIVRIDNNFYALSVAMAHLNNKKGCILKAKLLSDKQLNKFINDINISTFSEVISKYNVTKESNNLISISTESYYEKIIENCKGRVYDSFTVGSWFDDDGLTCYYSNAILLQQ